MKFYLRSDRNFKPCDDFYLKNSEFVQHCLREIEKVAGVEVTFEKNATFEGLKRIVVDIPSLKALAHIMKVFGTDLIIEQNFVEDDKYPTMCVFDDYIE